MRTALSFLLSLGTICASATAAAAVPAIRNPHVVLILADDLGYGDVGCFGATKIKTPNIDRLAREGRRFTNAYTPGSVCSPTRYGLMAGRYVWREPRHHPAGVHAPGGQLYNLADDPAESKNLWAERPDLVKRLSELLAKAKQDSRTRP